MTIPRTMRAMAIDGFGGPEVLKLHERAVPTAGADEVLIKVSTAGVGVWDGAERTGLMASLAPDSVKQFPRILGADGSGEIVAVGAGVTDFQVGEPVYAYGFFNPQGGFYAEYAAVPSNQVAPLPKNVGITEAGALAVTGITALRGVEDTLKLQAGQTLLVFGASGGVGLPAIQLAKAMGANVLAVVSNPGGAALAREAGADSVFNSKTDDLAACIAAVAPAGLDAVLACVNAPGLDAALAAVRDGGRVAWPQGVQPVPQVRTGVVSTGYAGTPGREVMDRLNRWIESGHFKVQISRTFALADAAKAHEALLHNHLGRMLLVVS